MQVVVTRNHYDSGLVMMVVGPYRILGRCKYVQFIGAFVFFFDRREHLLCPNPYSCSRALLWYPISPRLLGACRRGDPSSSSMSACELASVGLLLYCDSFRSHEDHDEKDRFGI